MDREQWMHDSSDVDEAADLTARLVAVPSCPGDEGEVQPLVADWLETHDLHPVFQETGEADRPNVIARVENGPGPTLLLNGHVDTVLPVEGWSSDPWRPWRAGDRLHGLGACDMKSGLAAAMLATRALARRPDLWRGRVLFTSVVDEEAYSVGARALIAAGLQADFCVVTEANWDEPCLGSVGKVLIRIDVTGKATHAAWPDAGVNAAVEAARLAARLGELPVADHPRMVASRSLLSFQSGSERYVLTVPDHARLLLNRQTVPGETVEEILAGVWTLITDLGSPATFELTVDPPFYPPWEVAETHPFIQVFSRAYAGETGTMPRFGYRGYGDANLFAGESGIPTVQFGPRGGNFHEANEWVDVPSIAGSARVLLRLALDVLRRG